MFGGRIGITELLIVLLIILLIFGATKLPALARSLGKSLGEFKKGKDEGMKQTEAPASEKKDEKTDAQKPA